MVRAVYQDSEGLMWMVSGDGLHFFDGLRYKAFCVPTSLGANDQDNMMRGICQAGKNKLLISSTASILEFDVPTATYKICMRQEGLYPEIVLSNFGGHPLIWIYGKGFFWYSEGKVQKLEIKGLGEGFFKSFFPHQAVWVSQQNKAFITSEKGVLEVQAPQNNTLNINALWHPNLAGCSGIAVWKSNQVCVAHKGSLYTLNQGEFQQKLCKLPNDSPVFLYPHEPDAIWVVSRTSNQLHHLKGAVLTKMEFFIQESRFIDNISPAILSVFTDKAGSVWFGTDGNGAILYNPNTLRLHKALIGFVRSVACGGKHVFAGTYLNGLWQLNTQLTTKTKIIHPLLPANAYCMDLMVDSYERLWVATPDRILVFDKDLKLVYHYDVSSPRAKFHQLTQQTMLFSNGNAFFFEAGKTIKLQKTRVFGAFSACLQLGKYLVFGNPYGLYRLDEKQLTDSSILLDQRMNLYAKKVNDLIHYDDAIWVATNNGIKVFNETLEPIALDKRLSELNDEKIYSLCTDTQNRLWFTGNNGIGCLLTNKGPIVRLGLQNNLQSLEFNQNAMAQSKNGHIYFGGIQGLNGFNPNNVSFYRPSSGVRLAWLMISDTLWSEGIPENDQKIEIEWKNAHISGSIASLNNENQELTTFSFILEGFQNTWGPRGYSRDFSYRNLPPGTYKLRVISYDAYQNKSRASTLLQIHIPPPYYQRTWFILLIVFSAILALILIVKRVQYMRFKQKLLDLQQQNAIDKERLRISQDMHDEIGASLTRISILSELAKNRRSNSEEALKIVNQISGIASKVVDDMGEIIWAMNPKNDSAEGFASYLRQYAANYLEQTGIEAVFNLQEDIPEIKLSSEMRRNLFLVVKEALHNVVKHSRATQVLIALHFQNQTLDLTIKDNGIGFEQPSTTYLGNGLKNMPLRIQNVGGSIQILAAKGEGVKIHIRINKLK